MPGVNYGESKICPAGLFGDPLDNTIPMDDTHHPFMKPHGPTKPSSHMMMNTAGGELASSTDTSQENFLPDFMSPVGEMLIKGIRAPVMGLMKLGEAIFKPFNIFQSGNIFGI